LANKETISSHGKGDHHDWGNFKVSYSLFLFFLFLSSQGKKCERETTEKDVGVHVVVVFVCKGEPMAST
jgi:hypothetical protein